MAHTAPDLCRVTLVAPRGRFDVALPAAVPLAYMLPTLLRQAGLGDADELAEAGTRHGGWVVQRLGGLPLDTGSSAAALHIVDGDVLYLRARQQELPPPVFDDVVEGIGSALSEHTRRWTPQTTRATAIAATGLLLGLGIAVTLTSGPPWYVPSVACGLITLLLLFGATTIARSAHQPSTGALVAAASVPYAFFAGYLGLLGRDPLSTAGSPFLLGGASAALAVIVVAMALVGGGEPALLGCAVAVAAGFAASAFVGAQGPTAVAALAAGLVFLLIPVIPVTAYRLARLPAPFLPASADDLRNANETLPAATVAERGLVADRYVTALIAAVALVFAVASAWLATSGGWAGRALAGVLTLLAVLRARAFPGVAQRLWLLGAAAAGVVAESAGLLRGTRLIMPVVLALCAFVAISFAARPDRKANPFAARMIDLLEIVVALAVLPLVLQVLGVYAYVRSLIG